MNIAREACDSVGGITALARILGIKAPSISKWIENNEIPPLRVIDVEKATGIHRSELRPDLYPTE